MRKYNNMTKAFNKNEVIYGECDGGKAYLTNGFFMRIISLDDYNKYLKDKKPFYPSLKEGDKYEYIQSDDCLFRNGKKPGLHMNEEKMNHKFKEFFEMDVKKATENVDITSFLHDETNVYGNYKTRIVISGNSLALFNEMYIQACDADNYEWKSEGKPYSPIVAEDAFILPIRYCQDFKYLFTKLSKLDNF